MEFLLDEFSLGDIKVVIIVGKNKYGYQLGVKYYNAFHIDNLLLQLEYNHVRPYMYSVPITNYGHNNQVWGISGVAILRICAIAHIIKEDTLQI
jgi:hypothetical protein